MASKSLTIEGIGRVKILAHGKNAEGKTIWVIRNGNFQINNIEYRNCSIPDKNGAGIRFENGTLTVNNSAFLYNENGILTTRLPNMQLFIYYCEFGYNDYGDGYSHNIYVGNIGKFLLRELFSSCKVGHLIKSRPAINQIQYSRITDETGTASYEIDIPNAGNALIVGNII